MEADNEEEPNRVQHITVKYELDESPSEDMGFHSSDGTGAAVENQQLEESEDCREEHFEIVLKPRSVGKPGDIIVVEKRTDEEVIEIDDSSEEETKHSVVSYECTHEQPVFDKEQSVDLKGTGQFPSVIKIESAVESEIPFTAFENAVDDWYSKLSVHGPLKDCEIIESARQLAQHFNFELLDDVEWLRSFKNRRLLKNKVLENDEQHEGSNGRTIKRRTKKKLEYMIKRRILAGGTTFVKRGNGYVKLSDDYLSESPDYPLLLQRAQNADPSERAEESPLSVSENPEKTCLIPKEISGRPHSIADVDRAEQPVKAEAENGGLTVDPMSKLEALVVEWYFNLTSQHKTMVASCIFESKAVEIARSLKLFDFRPTKTWVEQLIRRHGMWCTLSQNRSLFREPEDGLLKYRFYAEFEAWYHVFPDTPDSIEDYYLASKKLDFRMNMKSYLAAVFHWFTSQSSVVPANDILKFEAQQAELIGISNDDVQSVRELYRDWYVRHKQFNESVREAYNVGLPIMLPQVLKKVSLRWACLLKFNGFTPSQLWMRRYLQLNGLFYKKDEAVKWYSLDSASCNQDILDKIFRVWEGATVKGSTSLKAFLDKIFRENKESPLKKIENLPEEPESPLQIVRTFTLWSSPRNTSS